MMQAAGLRSLGTFADLGTGNTAMLAGGLRPLAWIDGLLTATMVSPQFVGPELWLGLACDDDALGNLTLQQMNDFAEVLMDRQLEIITQLDEQPDTYRPYLGSSTDRMAAAGEWAAGFRAGIRVQPEPWAPLIDNYHTRMVLVAIFCLERDEDLSSGQGANSPFADVPPERREQMRVIGVDLLPATVAALYVASVELAEPHDEDDLFSNLPYLREAPKTGRNEPCPCGSGKKYKKCCLQVAASLG